MTYDIFNIIASMPRLRELTLEGDIKIEVALPQNHSVRILDLKEFCNGFDFIMMAFPNVENLTMKSVDETAADLISESFPSLIKLAVVDFRAENLSNPDFFLNLTIKKLEG